MVAQVASSSVAGMRSFRRVGDRLAELIGDAEIELRGVGEVARELHRDRIVKPQRLADRGALGVRRCRSTTIWLTGSPAKRNIENEMIPTAIMTPIAWIARRRVKASM